MSAAASGHSPVVLDIDGDCVEVSGTTKGDTVERAALPRPWVWSRSRRAWVLPRSLRQERRDSIVALFLSTMAAAGRTVEVNDTGRRLTAQERHENRSERLAQRADRHESRAAAAAQTAEAAYAERRRIGDSIPMGQPILVGHHSEARHRRDLDRMDRAVARWIASEKTAEERARLARGLRQALDRGENIGVVRRRLDRLRADERDVRRRLDGTGSDRYGSGKPAEGQYRSRLVGRLDSLTDEIRFNEDLLAELASEGQHVWGREDFERGDLVMHRSEWLKVARVNARSLSVEWPPLGTWTLPYDRVQARWRAGVTWDGTMPAASVPSSGTGS